MNEGGGPILTTPPQPPPPPYPPPDYYDDAGEKNTTPQQQYNHAALITTVRWNQKPPAMPYAPKPMESTSASDALVIKSGIVIYVKAPQITPRKQSSTRIQYIIERW